MSNYLPLIVRDTLFKTGWTENELAVYSLLLEKGAMHLTDISSETNIPVSTIQYALKKLSLKKMICKTSVNGKPQYLVSNVEQLRKWMKGYNKQFLKYEEVIGQFIDQYDFNPQAFTSKVRFYEGIKGVKQSYRITLEEIQSETIFNYSYICDNQKDDLLEFFKKEFVPRRLTKKIHFQSIFVDTPFFQNFIKNSQTELRQIKVLQTPKNIEMNTEINIYDNYIHHVSFNGSASVAMIIRNANLAKFNKILFDSLWNTLE